MTPSERDHFERESMRPHVAAAVAEGLIELEPGESVDSVLSGMRFIRGVPSGPRAAAPVMRSAHCLVCSRGFKTIDRHEVCWPCRADARGEA